MSEAEPAKPDQTPEQKRQQHFMDVMMGELRALARRYTGLYGAHHETAVWSMYSVLLSELDDCAPVNQQVVMEALADSMGNRLKAFRGERPPAAAKPEPVAEAGAGDQA